MKKIAGLIGCLGIAGMLNASEASEGSVKYRQNLEITMDNNALTFTSRIDTYAEEINDFLHLQFLWKRTEGAGTNECVKEEIKYPEAGNNTVYHVYMVDEGCDGVVDIFEPDTNISTAAIGDIDAYYAECKDYLSGDIKMDEVINAWHEKKANNQLILPFTITYNTESRGDTVKTTYSKKEGTRVYDRLNLTKVQGRYQEIEIIDDANNSFKLRDEECNMTVDSFSGRVERENMDRLDEIFREKFDMLSEYIRVIAEEGC